MHGSFLYVKSNHLGNVLVTVTDRRNPIESQTTSGEIAYYEADIAAAYDYYPMGGMMMPGRIFNPEVSRYKYQGQESDDEIYGVGNSYAYKYRMSDPRLGGQMWSIDPLWKNYPGWSPYAFSQRRVINAIEMEGLQAVDVNTGQTYDDGSGTNPRYYSNVPTPINTASNQDAFLQIINWIKVSAQSAQQLEQPPPALDKFLTWDESVNADWGGIKYSGSLDLNDGRVNMEVFLAVSNAITKPQSTRDFVTLFPPEKLEKSDIVERQRYKRSSTYDISFPRLENISEDLVIFKFDSMEDAESFVDFYNSVANQESNTVNQSRERNSNTEDDN